VSEYTNFDNFLDEVEINERPKKGFALGEETFDLPDIFPAKLMLKISRLGKSNEDNLKGIDLILLTLLGEEQYERVLDLVPEMERLSVLATKIVEMYNPGTDSKNEVKTQRGKRK
jgi:hypothetical protein